MEGTNVITNEGKGKVAASKSGGIWIELDNGEVKFKSRFWFRFKKKEGVLEINADPLKIISFLKRFKNSVKSI